MVSPADDFETAYAIVRYGNVMAPEFEFDPVVETYTVFANSSADVNSPEETSKPKMRNIFLQKSNKPPIFGLKQKRSPYNLKLEETP
jgi:hypothetical protein